jgi:hypothetical protein
MIFTADKADYHKINKFMKVCIFLIQVNLKKEKEMDSED